MGATLKSIKSPDRVAACPSRIPFIKPRLRVKKGDDIEVGGLLFEDKQEPRFQFLSPGGGRIDDIRFGPRRVIRQIVITLARDESQVNFPTLTDQSLSTISRSDLVDKIVTGGIWPLILALPFRDIPDQDILPRMIFVGLDNTEPFQTAPEIYLKGNEELFDFGVRVLKRLSKTVYITAPKANDGLQKCLNGQINLDYTGKYPAGDPGVLLYHLKTTSAENNSWFIAGQDVLMMARLLTTGHYPTERIVAIGGSATNKRHHVQTRIGAPIADLLGHSVDPAVTRCVSGGVFRGQAISPNDFLGLYETALTLLPAGNNKEFMALFDPGWKKPSYSRVYLSRLNQAELTVNCNRHGDERACIACMHCADVCPVDILPQLTYKATLADEVEEALAHGLLDCVECGLCTYVCPSKIELTDVLKTAKAAYRKERGSG